MGRDPARPRERPAEGPLFVSVIVPCHNAAGTLRDCLGALRNQTRAPDEVIVVDDASTDDSAAIAAEFGCEVIRLAQNAGPSAARNTGIAAARGEVLFFTDSDVALRPDAVANAAALLESDAGLDIVHGTYAPEPLRGSAVTERYLVLREAFWRHRFAGPANVVVFAVAAVRRGVFDRFGPLDERLRDCEDVEYSARMGGRASIRIAESVAGSHDAGGSLPKALRTQWKRSTPMLSLRARGVRLERINRMRSLAATAAAIAALPVAVVAPEALAFTGAALAAALASDADLLRYAKRHIGFARTVPFAAVHLCFMAVLVCGIAAGAPASLARRGLRPAAGATPTTRNEPYATH